MKYSELFANCAWNVPYIHKDGWVSYCFVEKEDKLYIYFQGSHEVKDWFANFLFIPTSKRPYKDMDVPYRVHKGFLEAWKKIEDIIIEKVTQKTDSKFTYKKITVVGYSHGAALAGLCHECVWFWRPDLRDMGLVGFGFEAPRFYAGWHVKKELQERWDNFFVFRDGNDLVTHCPPAFVGFCHVGEIIKIKGDTALVTEKQFKCIKYHFPQVVYDGLLKFEQLPEEKQDEK